METLTNAAKGLQSIKKLQNLSIKKNSSIFSQILMANGKKDTKFQIKEVHLFRVTWLYDTEAIKK